MKDARSWTEFVLHVGQLILHYFHKIVLTPPGRPGELFREENMLQIKSTNRTKKFASLILVCLSFIMVVAAVWAPRLTFADPNGPNAVPAIAPGSAYRLPPFISEITGRAA